MKKNSPRRVNLNCRKVKLAGKQVLDVTRCYINFGAHKYLQHVNLNTYSKPNYKKHPTKQG